MEEMVGKEGERRLSEIGIEKMIVSMGYQACGALSLWNYPTWMRNLIPQDVNGEDRSDPVDMAALESNHCQNSYIWLPLYSWILNFESLQKGK